MPRTARLVPIAVSAALAVLAASAQVTPVAAQLGQDRSTLPPAAFSRVVSVNPVLLVFQGYISADYEQRASEATSVGLSLSSFNLSRADYLALEGKARYYLSGRALDGVSIGTIVGAVRLTETETDFRTWAMSVGFNAERQWLMGSEERLALTAGLGATRLFFAEERDAFRTVLPIVRLSIGWGF